MARCCGSASLSLVLALTAPRRSSGQHQGSEHTSAFRGDPSCWHYSSFGDHFDPIFQPIVRERPWLAQNILCAEGRGSFYWQGSRTFDRCCKNQSASLGLERRQAREVARAGAPPPTGGRREELECSASAEVRAACCAFYVEELCWSQDESESRDGLFSRCCPGPPIRAASSDYPAGCQTRMWLEETAMKIVLGAGNKVPTLRPLGLGRAAEVYLETGEALPSLRMLMRALARRHRDGLEMCPEAAVLAWLLELEDGLHFRPLSITQAKLRRLRRFWGWLAPALAGENGTASAWRRRPLGQLAALPGTVSAGFARLEAEARELRQVQQRRAGGRFRFDVVLAVCWPGDQINLLLMLKDAVPEVSLVEDGTVYVYDICYGLFPPGSPLYDLENRVEVELHGPAGRNDKAPKLPGPLRELTRRFGRAVLVPFHEEIGCGEVTVNLHHIARHYDDLADVLVFIHPDVVEHVQIEAMHRVMDSLARRLWPPGLSFLYLGHRHNGPVDASGRVISEVGCYCSPRHSDSAAGPSPRHWSAFGGGSSLRRSNFDRQPTGNWCQWLELAWELLFSSPMRLPGDDYGGYDFGQFVATREAARRRPKAFWVDAWRALSRRSNYELLLGTHFVSHRVDFATAKNAPAHHDRFHRGLGSVFEHLWHVIFFPDAKSWLWPTRFRDPTVPLSFKFEIHDRNPKMVAQYRWERSEPL